MSSPRSCALIVALLTAACFVVPLPTSAATIKLASSIAWDTQADIAYSWSNTATWEGGVVPGQLDDVILGSETCAISETSCGIGLPNSGPYPDGPRITIGTQSTCFLSDQIIARSLLLTRRLVAASGVTVKSLFLNGGYLSVVGTTASSTLNITNGLRHYGGGFQNIDMTVQGTSYACSLHVSGLNPFSRRTPFVVILSRRTISYGYDADHQMPSRRIFFYNTQLRNKGDMTTLNDEFTTTGTTYVEVFAALLLLSLTSFQQHLQRRRCHLHLYRLLHRRSPR